MRRSPPFDFSRPRTDDRRDGNRGIGPGVETEVRGSSSNRQALLRSYHDEPRPHDLTELKLPDRNDRLVVASALKAKAEVLITGDHEMLDLEEKPEGLQILSARDFWNLAVGKEPSKN